MTKLIRRTKEVVILVEEIYPLELFHYLKSEGMNDDEAKTTAACLFTNNPSRNLEHLIADYNCVYKGGE